MDSVLVIGLELATAALFVVHAALGRWRPDWQHTAHVLVVITLIASVLLTFAGARGLVRRLHDALLDNTCGTTLRYIFLMRYHLLVALTLVFFPTLTVIHLRRLLDTLFHVRPWDLFFISWMSLLTAWALMVGVQLTCAYGPQRFGGPAVRLRENWVTALRHVKIWIFAMLALPTIGVCIAYSEQRITALGAASLGTMAAWLTLVITAWQRETLVSDSTPPSHLLIDGSRFRRDADDEPIADEGEIGIVLPAILHFLGPGYYDPQRQRSQPGHLLAATLLGAVLCIYGLIGFAFRPSGGWNDWFPPLGYVLNLLMLTAWGLPAASFFFDRWRIPVLISTLALCVLFYSLAHTDHFFTTAPATQHTASTFSSPSSLTPEEAINAWIATRPANNDRLTVVTASGGGIAAAAWSAEVLCGLEEIIGLPFVQSLHAISSASGGSVGSMYYLDDFSYGQPRSKERLDRIRAAASRSSLPAMTWGVAYPDLWRFVAPPTLQCAPYLDRGWALEEAWRGELVEPNATLLDWRARVAKGEMPVALFDATAVETGRQFLLTPVDVHRAGGRRFQAYHNFLSLYQQRDINMATAARLSATFPWVTPITRAARDAGGPTLHVADGAYFDNYGMATMVEWLNSVLPTYTEQRHASKKKVLLIRISIRDTSFGNQLVYDEKEGWAYTLYGPLLTLLSAGSASQIARNEQLLELLTDRWMSNGQVELTEVNFVLRTEVPLSWQLTEQAGHQIRARWAEEVRSNQDFAQVQAFFTR
jgi:hypothetical protein